MVLEHKSEVFAISDPLNQAVLGWEAVEKVRVGSRSSRNIATMRECFFVEWYDALGVRNNVIMARTSLYRRSSIWESEGFILL